MKVEGTSMDFLVDTGEKYSVLKRLLFAFKWRDPESGRVKQLMWIRLLQR